MALPGLAAHQLTQGSPCAKLECWNVHNLKVWLVLCFISSRRSNDEQRRDKVDCTTSDGGDLLSPSHGPRNNSQRFASQTSGVWQEYILTGKTCNHCRKGRGFAGGKGYRWQLSSDKGTEVGAEAVGGQAEGDFPTMTMTPKSPGRGCGCGSVHMQSKYHESNMMSPHSPRTLIICSCTLTLYPIDLSTTTR